MFSYKWNEFLDPLNDTPEDVKKTQKKERVGTRSKHETCNHAITYSTVTGLKKGLETMY